MTPRIHLAHRILGRTLELAGLTLGVPEPDAGALDAQPAWLDLGPAEGVALLTGARRWPAATVQLEPPHRPTSAVVRVHVAQLTPAARDQPELVADVAIGPALLDDLGFEVAP